MPEELDELNRLFTSKNVEDVIKFYDHFDTPDQLIEWMKNRPSAPMKIYEVEGEKDLVVIIPTNNHNGQFAKNCKDVFKGLQIVFVESNGPFFNYARSCNYGFKYALKYNPKWIILSGHDVSNLDDISNLKYNLLKFTEYDLLILSPKFGHSFFSSISKKTFLVDTYWKFKDNEYFNLFKKFGITYFTPTLKLRRRLFYKPIYKFFSFTNFACFNYSLVKKLDGNIFDPVFINGSEDIFFCYKSYINKYKLKLIDYNLGNLDRSTLGTGRIRLLHSFASLVYLNFLFNY
jgi:hypothetical protein